MPPGRFALKTLERGVVRDRILRQELQRYLTFQPGVFGLIHDAHPTTTKLFDDTVVRNRTANERWALRHGADILAV